MRSAAGEIDAVAGAVIHAKLADPAADGFRVAEMAERKAVDRLEETRASPFVAQRTKPSAQLGRIDDDNRRAAMAGD